MRGKQAPKRKIKADPKFESILLSKFINTIMLNGKKSLAQKIVYQALDDAASKVGKQISSLDVFNKVMTTLRPTVKLKPRRVGGSNLQIPVSLTEEQGDFLAIRWIISAARARKGADMYVRLSAEFVDAYNGVGSAFKKKEEIHKMAEANKAYAHFNF
jgi:small subunit ribosomal protein S7